MSNELQVFNFTGNKSVRVIANEPDDAPWFVSEVPALMISTAYPYHLFDAPMVKTYVNAYAGTADFRAAVMDKLMGRSPFRGVSPMDPFCGREDTRQ